MKRKPKVALPPAPPSPKGGYRHGDRAEIPEEALTFREKKVLDALRTTNEPLTVRCLARKCFPGVRAKVGTYETTSAAGETLRHATDAAYRVVLNSLRRLVVGGFVKKVERGTYAPIAQPKGSAPSTDGEPA